MSNTIKYSEGSESLALNKGNWWIGTGDSNKGPTVESGYWNAINPPDGGYTVYLNKETNGPSIHSITSDENLISFTNKISGNNYTTVAECLVYYQTQDDKLCVNREIENIVTDGLIMYLDSGIITSYPGSGTTWYDLSGNGYNSTMVGVLFNSNGYMTFPGTGERDSLPVGEYVTLNTAATTTNPSTKADGTTYSVWMRFTGNQLTGHGIFYGSTTRNHIEFRSSDVTNGYWRTEAVIQNGYSFGGGGNNLDGGHSLDEWFNLTIVFANNEETRPVRWYRDGVLFYTGNMTSGTNPSGEYFQPNAFGRSTGNDTYQYVESFKGDMSILIIYDKALTESEILQNYNAQKSRFGL